GATAVVEPARRLLGKIQRLEHLAQPVHRPGPLRCLDRAVIRARFDYDRRARRITPPRRSLSPEPIPRRETQMRLAKAIAMAGALAVMAGASASAAPLIPNPGREQATNIIQVPGGCGRGAHPNRWGRCVPNRYGYGYGYGYYRPGPYYRWHG